MTILATFASIVGVPTRLAEDALHSERAARHTLSRRGMMGALAAMAVGNVMPLPAMPAQYVVLVNGTYPWRSMQALLAGRELIDVKSISWYDGTALDIGCHTSDAISVADSERGA
jgi:hypothetical protein